MREVLYVEDDDRLRELYGEALRNAGFKVSEHALAEHALDYLGRRTPDILLLDLGMPPGTMSGMELLARVRENPAWSRIPVVVLSGFGDMINPDAIGRLGVTHVLTKATARAGDIVRTLTELLGTS